ncbi:HTH-type transcriptional regulator ArgP [Achromobacter anxifer]|jgi:DNA-binding transcriptional LysR family regulator|uniref:LysR family transcriptional regulator n=1 Tax=Achromobacter anxifer TaxID=1287737 RepID=UPI00155BB6C9|nr:LysR family transcriptional regulator [Achromobacter anxifer]CAB5517482.1 HTH-type transcriptional regulator ArgP [Achromobacter anxifer]
MDTKSLTLLVEILDAGNLSEAARRLKMTRANVSYHLNQLERSVGMQLVRRTTRHVEPTEIGLKLYQHGRSIQDELAAARESVETLGKTPQGKVRLSVPSGYGQFVMTPWLLEFKRAYPDIVLDVLFENSVDDLLRDEVDIAVRIMSEPPQNLVARELGQVRYVACASQAYAAARGLPQHPEELSRTPVISAAVIGRPLRLSAYYGGRPRQHVVLEPTVISRNYAFLRDAIRAGLGVGVVPDYVVHDDIARGDLLAALPQWRLSIFGRGMYMLYMPNRHHPRAISMIIEFILERAQAAHEGRPGLLEAAG